MSRDSAIIAALRHAGICEEIATTRPLSGGCIHEVVLLSLSDGRDVVAKLNHASKLGLFEEEAAGLRALDETNTVLVPRLLSTSSHDDTAVMLMDALEAALANDSTWAAFGRDLAALHACKWSSQYGFATDNHLGTTPQPNDWCDDWVQFNAEHRLGHQLNLLRPHLSNEETRDIQRVIDQLDQFIPHHPKPSLLHGDLWAGNALPVVDATGKLRIGVIDPACSVGDGWADIAMMKLFGGFPKVCLDEYASTVGDHVRIESRIAVYQLYHVLNHITIFGRGYIAQAMSLARSLTY